MQKKDGGMGYRYLYVYNISLLGKQGWRLMMKSDSSVSKSFKAKYFPNLSFLEAKKGSNLSYVWRKLVEAKVVLKEGTRWSIWGGSSIKDFGGLWTHDHQQARPRDNNAYNPFLRVIELIEQNKKTME